MKARQRKHIRLALRLAAAVALVFFFLFPLYWLFMMSFKTANEIYAYPPVWWPASLRFDNYLVLFKDGDARSVWNSLIVASLSTLAAMLLGSLCAYSLARYKTGGAWCRRWRWCSRSSCCTSGSTGSTPTSG